MSTFDAPTKDLLVSDEPALSCVDVAGFDPPGQEELGQGDFVGRYSVLSCLGRGGMGVVYKAYDPQLDRNVALKLLRRGDRSVTAELRLMREAQTLARLSHPNVVAVYDSGITNHGVFIAMELLSGKTVSRWLEPRTRTLEEILAVFQAAGRGLVAAHQAGLVHRDFKPGNVIVGDDGSVRVLDFGLAHLVDDTSPGRGDVVSSKEERTTDPEREAVLDGAQTPGAGRRVVCEVFATAAGQVTGTPAFMAPEQIAGLVGDQRSEQFAFAMSLYVSLYGRSPLGGKSYEERRQTVERGLQISERDLERGADGEIVPPRVRRVIIRALSDAPEDRFRSMTELLAELEPPRHHWRRVVIASFISLAGFGLGAMVFDAPDEDAPCSDPTAALEGAWGPADRTAVESAFAHEETASSLPRVTAQLDRYTADWIEMYEASCRATFVTRQQSGWLFDQRMRCLERRRNRLRSSIEALLSAEAPQVLIERTILPFQLPGLEPCADLDALAAEQALPDDESQRAEIEELRRRIDEADTLHDAGDFPRGLIVAQEVLVRARRLAYLPVVAEALASLGRLQASGASARDAQATLEEAVLVAAQADDERTEAAAWTWLLFCLGVQRRIDEALALELAARSAVGRSHDQVLSGWLLNNLGVLHGRREDHARASEHFRRALEVKQEVLGPGHVDVGISWFNLGTALMDADRPGDAREPIQQARAIFEVTVGPAHPMTHYAMSGICRVEHAEGRPEVAVRLCSEVVQLFDRSPPAPWWQASVRFTLAQAQWDVGHQQHALETARVARDYAVDDPALAHEIDAWLDDPVVHAAKSRAARSVAEARPTDPP